MSLFTTKPVEKILAEANAAAALAGHWLVDLFRLQPNPQSLIEKGSARKFCKERKRLKPCYDRLIPQHPQKTK